MSREWPSKDKAEQDRGRKGDRWSGWTERSAEHIAAALSNKQHASAGRTKRSADAEVERDGGRND